MSYKEISDRESVNLDSIWLYQEGGFYKAYERSAFALCSRFGGYKVYCKELGQNTLLYVSLPKSAVDRSAGSHNYVREDKLTVRITLPSPISVDGYLSWREGHVKDYILEGLTGKSYDILPEVIAVCNHLSDNCKDPFGLQMKRLSFKACDLIRSLGNAGGDRLPVIVERLLRLYDELDFTLRVMSDCHEVPTSSYDALSEQIRSVVKYLSAMR